MPYFVYFLRCEDNSLYIGTSNDVEKRYEVHKQGKGAKYTRMHPVKKMECSFCCESKSEALKLEYFFKSWSKLQKESFLKDPSLELGRLLYQEKIKRKQKK